MIIKILQIVKLEKQNIEQTKLLSMVILSIVKKKRIIIAN